MILGHVPAHTSLTKVTAGVPQLSVAVTSVISGAGTCVMHSKVVSAGHVIVGAVMSSTVIVWTQVEVLPQLSVAMYVRVMILGQLPLHISLTKVTAGVPQLSVAVTRLVSGAGTSLMHSKVRSAGQVICGGVMSSTVIVCAHVAVFPQLSVAI